MSTRSVEDCPYRSRPTGGHEEQTVICQLVHEILRVDNSKAAQVNSLACQACCESFEPTPHDLNPIIASLLFGATEQLLQSDKVAEVDKEHLRSVQARAESNLPVVLPDEDDKGVKVAPDWAARASATVDDLLQIIPPNKQRSGRPISTWAVGVTTSARRQPTLEDCLKSIGASGWSRPRLYVDGNDVELPSTHGNLPSTVRNPRVGAWLNFYTMVGDLLDAEPDADALLLLQDDALFPATPAVREYLERVLWPGPQPTLVSLYCCADYTDQLHGWSPWNETWRYGALAFVFPRQLAVQFLADGQVKRHAQRTDGF